jgi:hypothetical protein
MLGWVNDRDEVTGGDSLRRLHQLVLLGHLFEPECLGAVEKRRACLACYRGRCEQLGECA